MTDHWEGRMIEERKDQRNYSDEMIKTEKFETGRDGESRKRKGMEMKVYENDNGRCCKC